MNYSQTLAWLFKRLPMYQRVGAPAMRLGLDQMNRLSAALGNPHRSLSSAFILLEPMARALRRICWLRFSKRLDTQSDFIPLPIYRIFESESKSMDNPLMKNTVVDFVKPTCRDT